MASGKAGRVISVNSKSALGREIVLEIDLVSKGVFVEESLNS